MGRSKIKNLGLLITGSLCIAAPITVMAAPNECADWIAKVVSTEGRVETRLTPETAWQSVALNQILCPGSVVHTQAHSRAALLLRNNTVLRLSQKSTLTLPAAQPDKPFWLELLDGAINVITRTPKKFQVDTPFVNAAVDGTEFFVKVARAPLPEGAGINSGQTTVSVFEGRVIAENPSGRVTLRRGEAATAGADQAPVTSIPINSREAVQWALHYPPILSYRLDDFKEGDASSWQARVRKSIEYTQAGDLQNALASVIDTPQDAAAAFFGYRASLLLNVGRVNEASADIKTALDIAPNDGTALALQSVIAVAQNQYETALTLAKQSTAQAPQVAGSWMALSYAQQANFNLPEALNAAQHGADSEPDNALAWARIAELHLMAGNLDGALAAASKATALNSHLARTQSVLGFAYLTQIKTRHARQVFEQAIMLDQADPLPRLGLGLAKIRDGDLATGREDIEIATALDPNNALVRSYMGKAYYEEKRDPLAATQFDIAKTLDPKDPTPWFYDAILKQSTNRPVEALQDLQKSIELNDNRAVYRSRLLLDQDQAARSASQARIYSDLGFQQLALVEGWKSLNADPTNHSAHRLLADSYAALPRHEIARVSELLQAQLLQPININPIQPQLGESNLGILDGAGPSRAGFNEFNPLFTHDRIAFQANGIMGNNNTTGNDIAVSGIQGKLSYSLGQFHYETDGFRPNNDLTQDIYNLFIQTSLSPSTSAQAEYRYTNKESGDLPLRFYPNNFSKTLRKSRESETFRVGLRHAFSPSSDVITSLIYQNAEDRFYDSVPIVRDITDQDNGYIAEVQHLFRSNKFTLTSGIGHYGLDRETTRTIRFSPFIPSSTTLANSDIQNDNAYSYIRFNNPTFIIIAGASADKYKGDFEKTQINPKFGVIWNLSPSTALRIAAFRVLKKELTTNQTLEPTQVAGFNQFFDDRSATDSRRYGAAIDKVLYNSLYGGAEFSKRDMDIPIYVSSTTSQTTQVVHTNWKETMGRAYLYSSHSNWISVNVEYQYEGHKREVSNNLVGVINLATHKIPISLNLFHLSNFSLQTRATYTDQKGKFIDNTINRQQEGNDQFLTLDIRAVYRLPKRRGTTSIEIRNIADKNDFNFFEMDNANPKMPIGKLITARLTLNF